jgi:hypothetical protein
MTFLFYSQFAFSSSSWITNWWFEEFHLSFFLFWDLRNITWFYHMSIVFPFLIQFLSFFSFFFIFFFHDFVFFNDWICEFCFKFDIVIILSMSLSFIFSLFLPLFKFISKIYDFVPYLLINPTLMPWLTISSWSSGLCN